jgi:hypothetical protein
MIKTSRRRMTFATAVVAGVMALASAAFACTVYKGTMIVTDARGNTSQGTGSGLSMGFCSGTTNTSAADIGRGESFTIDVEPFVGSGSQQSCTNKLNDDLYDVNYSSSSSTGDCMSGDPAAVLIAEDGLQTVNGSDSGNNSFVLPSNAPVGASGICVSDDTAGEGMQVSVEIL